jgi:hypothetical protein
VPLVKASVTLQLKTLLCGGVRFAGITWPIRRGIAGF